MSALDTLPRAIVWDWDNTLADGWPAIMAGLNAAFSAFGLPQWTLEEVRANVRKSLRDSFPAIFGAEWTRARDIFYAEVRARHLVVLEPMPGAGALLAEAQGLARTRFTIGHTTLQLESEPMADCPDC